MLGGEADKVDEALEVGVEAPGEPFPECVGPPANLGLGSRERQDRKDM